MIAGRYFVGEDSEPVFVTIEAKPMTFGILETSTVNYEYTKYFISKIDVISGDDFRLLWQKSRDYRETVFGRAIDFVPEEPTSVRSSPQG